MELSDQEEREQILKQLGKFAQEGENVEEEERPEVRVSFKMFNRGSFIIVVLS